MKTWITYGFDKIVADMPAQEVLKKEFSLSLTKGGKETCQFVVNSETDTQISVKPVIDGVKCTVYYMPYTVPIDGHQHTDPIIPYGGETVEVKAGISLPFFSSGGSATISQMIDMGIILGLSRFCTQKK